MQIKIHRYKEKNFQKLKCILTHTIEVIYLHSDQAVTPIWPALSTRIYSVRLDEDMDVYIHSEHDAMPQDIIDLDDVFDYYLDFFEESVSEQIEKVKNKKAISMVKPRKKRFKNC